ncbi:MAG: hypothetical protein N0C81_03525 [Candidatus Thiodiazotropha lotti]|nr:hypothetical protein [Candidatus Thiodiazotropha lotti]MCG8004738.1 hypothetical protein [Candidatus Thiodiazotropha lotti]MCG8006702.1 hypothetical protein [Candidatus Thiodiazotropha lotti]MCW4188365.1 hypothetical protein [Candidatus Thiodiazotropha lotti]MCW4194284.1 hypothetical protein [Candidatus Thiodiazotropha lotti]
MIQNVGDDNLFIHPVFKDLNDLLSRTIFDEYSKFLSIFGVTLYFCEKLVAGFINRSV